MDLASILLSAALALLAVMIIARSLIERTSLGQRRPTRAETLAAERETVVAALRELDFDHATGKIAEEDYTTQRAALLAQGVTLLKQLDEISDQSPPQALDDELEAAIRAARNAVSLISRTIASAQNAAQPWRPRKRQAKRHALPRLTLHASRLTTCHLPLATCSSSFFLGPWPLGLDTCFFLLPAL